MNTSNQINSGLTLVDVRNVLMQTIEDLKNGKDVDISNYVINENKDYTTKLTSDVYSVSLKLEKTIDKIVKFIFNEVGKNIND